MYIVMVGDVVGSPGREILKKGIAFLKSQHKADFVIVNAENSAGGRGITPDVAEEIIAIGADVITLGDHTWDQKEIKNYLDKQQKILRPANFSVECPGKGYVSVNSPFGPVTVINLIGRAFMATYDCPYRAADFILQNNPASKIIFVDFHAEATSEKVVMGHYLDGRVTCVAGTHTHVQTSDEQILPNGTAYITDLGMTGPSNSALGRDLESVTRRLLTGMPESFKVSKEPPIMEGIIVGVDHNSGKALSIERFRFKEKDFGNIGENSL